MLYSGNADLLKSVTQMGLLWFLPSFISVVAIRSLIEQRGAGVKAAALALLGVVHLFIGTVAATVQDFLPLGLLPALYIVPLAYAGVALQRALFERIGTTSAIVLSGALFVAVKAWQMHLRLSNEVGFAMVADYTDLLALLVNDLEAVSGTLMLFQLARLDVHGLIGACGKYSMQIYLFHAFVALGIYKLLTEFAADAAPELLFPLSMLATILLTLALAYALMRLAPLRRLVFPRSLGELAGKA